MKTPQFWHRQTLLSTLLQPVSYAYYAVSKLHRCSQKMVHPPRPLARPVICVGNAIAGGAGKTPTARMLAGMLKISGQTPHLISRGYGGRPQKEPLRVEAVKHLAAQVGDEPLLLSQTAPCWVCTDRTKAAQAAIDSGATVVIADDGLQNLTFHKDIRLLVIDSDYGVGNGKMIPAGPLREPLSRALQRSDAVILIGRGEYTPDLTAGIPLWRAHLDSVTDFSDLRGKPVIAFAGIAHPEKFFHGLRLMGIDLLETLPFPDHHPYHSIDIAQLIAKADASGATLITTAKDAVKLPPSFAAACRVAEVKLQLDKPKEFLSWLEGRIAHG